jgi:hypothetical protein
MAIDLLRSEFERTERAPAPVRARVRRELAEATLGEAAGKRPSRLPARAAMRPAAAVVLVLALAIVAVRSTDAPRTTPLADTYGLAWAGTPSSLSQFDARSRWLLRSEGATAGVRDLGHAGDSEFYRFRTVSGHSCYGVAATISTPRSLSQLSCFDTRETIPSPVVDMSTYRMDPAVGANHRLHLVRLQGVAAREVARMVVTTSDGTVISTAVAGDVYSLVAPTSLRSPVASVAALSDSGTVLWRRTF